jgi:glycine betaine/proline transport system substrate-binding protein
LHKKWSKIIFIGVTLILTLSLMAACSPAAQEEKPTIKFADSQFETLWINNEVAKYILEEGYGYPTESVITTTPIAQVAMLSGDMDVWMETWQQNFPENYAEMMASGNLENLGDAYEGGPQFFVIPQYSHEELGINTISDMVDKWEHFQDPENPDRGVFYNSPIGWQGEVVNHIKMEAYGITDTYNIVAPGNGGALLTALSTAQKKKQHVFGYYWAPTALMGMYDWYVVEEPAYDKAVWDKIGAAQEDESLRPIDEACAYEDLPVDITVWAGLRDIAPDAVEMLEKYTAGMDPINKVAAWATENEVQNYQLAAVYYLRNYEDRWQTWVTDDAYDLIKAALALEP